MLTQYHQVSFKFYFLIGIWLTKSAVGEYFKQSTDDRSEAEYSIGQVWHEGDSRKTCKTLPLVIHFEREHHKAYMMVKPTEDIRAHFQGWQAFKHKR